MMTSVVQERTNNDSASNNRVVPPSVLLIGKKHAVDYIAPGLFRLNNTGEVIIKATGSLSIVTAVDVAEMIKRDVENVLTRTISLGTDSLVLSTGESKRMSCIEIRLSKSAPEPAAVKAVETVQVAVAVESAAPVLQQQVQPAVEAPVDTVKKTRTRRKATNTTSADTTTAAAGKKKKKITRKKKVSDS